MMLGITGARGFIGSNLRMHLNNIRMPYIVMEGDNFEPYLRNGITHIIHLAGRTAISKDLNFLDYLRDNVLLSSKVLDFSRRVGALVLLFSTYGYHPSQGVPSSAYHLSKALLEDVASYYAVQFNLNVQVLRLGSVFGPHQNHSSLLSNILTQIRDSNQTIYLRNISALRSYVSVKDVIEFIMLSLDKNVGFKVHFVGDSNLLSVRDFAESALKVMGCIKKVDPAPNDKAVESEIYLSESIRQNVSMGNHFSWVPRYSLFQGLSEALL